jgi:hypothetical protein
MVNSPAGIQTMPGSSARSPARTIAPTMQASAVRAILIFVEENIMALIGMTKFSRHSKQLPFLGNTKSEKRRASFFKLELNKTS